MNFKASCTCSGSPTPTRKKPSKFSKGGVVSGFTLFLLLNVLNISTIGTRDVRSPSLKGRCKRQSNEKNSLSLRKWFRSQSTLLTRRVRELYSLQGCPEPSPKTLLVIGCAERAWMRVFTSNPLGNSAYR